MSTPATDALPISDAELAERLRTSLARLTRLARTCHFDLTPSQLSVLSAVAASPHSRVTDLARELDLSTPTTTRIVQALVDKQLLERRTDPTDKRVCLIDTTERGRQDLRTMRSQAGDVISRRLRELNKADQAILRRAVSALERLAGTPKRC